MWSPPNQLSFTTILGGISFSMHLTKKTLCALVNLAAIQLAYAQFTPTDTGRTCNAGQYDNGNVCVPCPQDTITDKPGSFRCTPCPAGTISEYQSRRCVTCRPGTYQQPLTYGCNRCPDNSFSNKLNSRECTKCPPGSPNPRAESLKDCRPCPKGRYQDLSKYVASCKICPQGSYQPNQGATSCIPCPVGTTSKTDSRSGGAPTSLDRCYQCSPGTFSTHVYNTTATSGPRHIVKRVCSLCPEGHYSPSKGSKTCLKCPMGSVPDENRSRCLPNCTSPKKCPSCPEGMQPKHVGMLKRRNKCVKCAAGTVNTQDSTTECVQCPSDLVPNADRTACVCPPPLVLFSKALPYDNEQSCFKCPEGTVRVDGETCRCAEGRQWYTRTHQLGSPTLGKCRCKPFETERNGNCFPCPAKKLKKAEDKLHTLKSCNTCDLGEVFNETRGTCESCPAGYTNVASLDTCEKCSDATEGLPGCPCKPGRALDKGIIGRCVPCQPGDQVNPKSYTLGCITCPLGTFGDEYNQVKCKSCGPGRDYRYERKGRACPPRCGENTELVQGLFKPFCKCKLEFGLDGGTTDVVNCKKCPGNMVSRYGERCGCLRGYIRIGTTCKICPAGTMARINKCEPCAANFITPTAGGVCSRCEEGSYWIGIGGTRCVKCPEGQFVNKNGKCKSCKPGFRVRNGICIACVDSVSDGGAVAFCHPCEEGKKPGPDGRTCV